MREKWGLAKGQKLSPGWAQHLAFALTVTTSYAGAAAMLCDLGHRIDDSLLHRLAQKLGKRAQAQSELRLAAPAVEQAPQRGASELSNPAWNGMNSRRGCFICKNRRDERIVGVS